MLIIYTDIEAGKPYQLFEIPAVIEYVEKMEDGVSIKTPTIMQPASYYLLSLNDNSERIIFDQEQNEYIDKMTNSAKIPKLTDFDRFAGFEYNSEIVTELQKRLPIREYAEPLLSMQDEKYLRLNGVSKQEIEALEGQAYYYLKEKSLISIKLLELNELKEQLLSPKYSNDIIIKNALRNHIEMYEKVLNKEAEIFTKLLEKYSPDLDHIAIERKRDQLISEISEKQSRAEKLLVKLKIDRIELYNEFIKLQDHLKDLDNSASGTRQEPNVSSSAPSESNLLQKDISSKLLSMSEQLNKLDLQIESIYHSLNAQVKELPKTVLSILNAMPADPSNSLHPYGTDTSIKNLLFYINKTTNEPYVLIRNPTHYLNIELNGINRSIFRPESYHLLSLKDNHQRINFTPEQNLKIWDILHHDQTPDLKIFHSFQHYENAPDYEKYPENLEKMKLFKEKNRMDQLLNSFKDRLSTLEQLYRQELETISPPHDVIQARQDRETPITNQRKNSIEWTIKYINSYIELINQQLKLTEESFLQDTPEDLRAKKNRIGQAGLMLSTLWMPPAPDDTDPSNKVSSHRHK